MAMGEEGGEGVRRASVWVVESRKVKYVRVGKVCVLYLCKNVCVYRLCEIETVLAHVFSSLTHSKNNPRASMLTHHPQRPLARRSGVCLRRQHVHFIGWTAIQGTHCPFVSAVCVLQQRVRAQPSSDPGNAHAIVERRYTYNI